MNYIPPGALFWDGCVDGEAANINVYVWTLELENCHHSILLDGDVLLAATNPDCEGDFTNDDPKDIEVPFDLVWATDIMSNSEELEFEVRETQVQETFGSSLALYPNPVSSEFNLEFYTKQGGATQISIYNVEGQNILARSLKTQTGFNKTVIDATILSEGLYFVTLTFADGKVLRKKFMKN